MKASEPELYINKTFIELIIDKVKSRKDFFERDGGVVYPGSKKDFVLGIEYALVLFEEYKHFVMRLDYPEKEREHESK